ACDKRTCQIVAMKEEFNGLSTSTLREVSILKALPQHPATVEFKEVVRDDWDRVFVVMEHVENDLARFMAVRRQPMRRNEVKCIMKQLLEGVKFLHENGLMHRDLKPSNILINKKGEMKICNFGLSRQFESESGSYSPRVATLWYRAPEILARVETYSTAIDMWSVDTSWAWAQSNPGAGTGLAQAEENRSAQTEEANNARPVWSNTPRPNQLKKRPANLKDYYT
ncbi:UNVERIFIED_CONTAM: Cyclin-dependent kinase G-1, partial [Sesamum latifolium]